MRSESAESLLSLVLPNMASSSENTARRRAWRCVGLVGLARIDRRLPSMQDAIREQFASGVCAVSGRRASHMSR